MKENPFVVFVVVAVFFFFFLGGGGGEGLLEIYQSNKHDAKQWQSAGPQHSVSLVFRKLPRLQNRLFFLL